jgi:cholesterol transport system auxiliary component
MSRSSTTAVLTCLCVVVTTASGCVDLKKSYPEKRSFVLDVGVPPQEAALNTAIVLKVNKFRVSPLFAGRAMVYRVADLQYETDFYDEWFVAPATLVTQQVQHALSRSSGFQMGVLGTNHVEPTHLLEGTVTEFYGDFRTTPLAVLGLDLYLLDAVRDRQPLFRRTYHQEVPLRDRSSEALAIGLSDALTTILAEVGKDLAAIREAPQQSGR